MSHTLRTLVSVNDGPDGAPEISGHHVAGLVVGEGCFYAESAEDPKYRLGWRVRPGFCIEMRYDDLPALQAVMYHLGCGRIYHLDFGRYRGYEEKGWKPHVKFRVTRISDLHGHVVPFFEANPLFGRKREAFRIFAELVEHIYRGAHRAPDGLERARSLAAELSEHNS